MESIAHVGMDVDKEKIAIAVVKDFESEPRLQQMIRNRADAVEKLVTELKATYDRVTLCYEAGAGHGLRPLLAHASGACGFELYRRITDLGALCVVVAPASVPKKANDRIKTDRRDAVKLAMGLRSGELSPVYVPTREDEALRDYLRAYEDIKAELKRAKQRLVHFLLRHEIRCQDGKNWSAQYWRWLRSLTFDSPMMALAFEECIGQITRLEETRKRIADGLKPLPPRSSTRKRYRRCERSRVSVR